MHFASNLDRAATRIGCGPAARLRRTTIVAAGKPEENNERLAFLGEIE
jgi:hypothetical protein